MEPAPTLAATLILNHFINIIWLGCNLPLDGQDSSGLLLCAPAVVSSCGKYALFPFEPAPTSQGLPAGPALGYPHQDLGVRNSLYANVLAYCD